MTAAPPRQPQDGAAEVRARAAALRSARVAFATATVVRAERPTSAKPGDEALVTGDGTMVGFVGGDCAESTVRDHALDALDTGEPLLLRITPDGPHGEAHAGEGARVVHNPCLSGGLLEVFIRPELPAPLVVVHGDSPIAAAVRGVAASAGLELADAGDPAAPLLPEGAAAVVVASHGRDEAAMLSAALAAGVPYVALVASRRRGAAVLEGLDADAGEVARVRTPAGLDIGARTPGEVALSILAELVASRRRPAAGVAPAAELGAGHQAGPEPHCCGG